MPNNFTSEHKSLGFDFPNTEEEIELFDKNHSEYVYLINPEDIDPFNIINKANKEPKLKIAVNNVDFHKRTVLAAEIVYQLKNDNYLGHLKLQKIIYLCNNVSDISLHVNFLKQAMGPYDPKLMRSLDKQFKEKKWFEFQKDNFPKYKPLEKCGEHRNWFEKYFQNEIEKINFIITTFRNFSTSKVELIATIFGCWKDQIENKVEFSNEILIQSVYEWHPSKDKFNRSEIIEAINWMKEKGIYPAL